MCDHDLKDDYLRQVVSQAFSFNFIAKEFMVFKRDIFHPKESTSNIRETINKYCLDISHDNNELNHVYLINNISFHFFL